MSDITLNLTPQLYTYMQNHSLRESEILRLLREQTHTMSMGHMQISPEQGQFMQLLIELMGAQKTLEIGVFTGYSALVVALALPPTGKVIACDINVEWTKIAQKYWEMAKITDKIDLKIAPAIETLQQLLDQGHASTFDFVFIDADKQNYPLYFELSLALVRQGGLIMIDNVFRNGDVANPEIQDLNVLAIRQLNEKLINDQRISLSMLPIGDGLTLARRR